MLSKELLYLKYAAKELFTNNHFLDIADIFSMT